MILKIDDKTKISMIQQEFNALFPYLRIDFFKLSRAMDQSSFKKNILNPDLIFNQFRNQTINGNVELDENMKVSDLENSFQTLFDVSAQVFRKSAGSWIETSVTDGWTLKQQNDEGRDLNDFVKNS